MKNWLKAWLLSTPAPVSEPEPDQPRRVNPISYDELAMGGRSPADPWQVASPAPGVIPRDATAMAMDGANNGFNALTAWAQESLWSEGLGFLGYPYLAELSQRPEYRRISEIIAEAMTRKWIKLNGDETRCTELEEAMKRFRVREHFRKIAELDGFFGRAHLAIRVAGDESPGEMDKPLILRPEKIGKGNLKGFKAVEPLWCYPGTYESTNPLDDDYYRPRDWYVMGRTVHRTRLLPFVGREMPDMLKPAYQFGGLSMSQMAKPYVDNWLRTRQSVSDMIKSFSVMVLKTNLQSLLQQAGAFIKRIMGFNKTRDNRGLMVIDKDTEELDNVSAPLGTLDSLQAQSQEQLASVSGIPLVELLGVTPAGLNASSEGELKAYYGRIHDDQEHLFRDHLQTVLNVIMLNEWGEIDESITFEFIHLWEMDDKAKAEINKSKTDSAVSLVDASIISPEEARSVLNEDEESPYFGSLTGEAPEPPEPDNDEDGDEFAEAAE